MRCCIVFVQSVDEKSCFRGLLIEVIAKSCYKVLLRRLKAKRFWKELFKKTVWYDCPNGFYQKEVQRSVCNGC